MLKVMFFLFSAQAFLSVKVIFLMLAWKYQTGINIKYLSLQSLGTQE